MESIEFLLSSLSIFVLAWARILGVFIIAPVFSSPSILMRMRVVFAFTVTLCLVPWLKEYLVNLPENTLGFGVLLMKEFSLGAIMGMLLSFIFTAFRLGANFFSIQLGFSVAEIFDVMGGQEGSLWGYFFYLVATLVFLEVGGMHLVIKAVSDSYELIPVVDFFSNGERLMEKAMGYFSKMFVIALKLSFPIIATAMILIFALGVIGKIAPQANIFLIGLPVQMGVGILFILIMIPYMVDFFSRFIDYGINDIMQFLKTMEKRPL